MGVTSACSDPSDDDAVELPDDGVNASVELAPDPVVVLFVAVLVPKIAAFDPESELTTYVPPPL